MIVYYSNNGMTKLHADILAVLINHSLYELQEEEKRSMNALGIGKAVFETLFAIPAKLAELPDVSKEKAIYICSPIWAGNISAPAKAFIKQSNLANKKVNVILTCTNSSESETYKNKALELLHKQKCNIGFVSALAYERKGEPNIDLIRRKLKKLVLNVDASK